MLRVGSAGRPMTGLGVWRLHPARGLWLRTCGREDRQWSRLFRGSKLPRQGRVGRERAELNGAFPRENFKKTDPPPSFKNR
jgi:hypothetical protein